jgi:hypothetical protein
MLRSVFRIVRRFNPRKHRVYVFRPSGYNRTCERCDPQCEMKINAKLLINYNRVQYVCVTFVCVRANCNIYV